MRCAGSVTHALGATTMKSFDELSDAELLRELRRAHAELPDAPPALQRAALNVWRAAPAASAAASGAAAITALAAGLHSRLTALLSFDSWAAPLSLQGMRSVRTPTRQLLFSAERRDIDLRITPTAGVFSITGQVLGPDTAGSVDLLAHIAAGAPAQPAQRAQLDPLGEFRIDGVAAGRYAMTLRLGDDEIVLPAIDVGAAADEVAEGL